MNAIQIHRVQADLVTECTHLLRISYTWILLIFSYRWWFGFIESCLNCMGGSSKICWFVAFYSRPGNSLDGDQPNSGLSCQLMVHFISLTWIEKWAGGALQAVGARPKRVVANFRKLHNGSLPGSYSRWGRDLSSERLLRNNDVNSSLRMWEQCSNRMKGAISVIRKPEKSGA